MLLGHWLRLGHILFGQRRGSVRLDNGDQVGKAAEMSRSAVMAWLSAGDTVSTIIRDKENRQWNQGAMVEIVTREGKRYIRTDPDNNAEDNLGCPSGLLAGRGAAPRLSVCQVKPFRQPDVGTQHVIEGAHSKASRKTRPVRCPASGRHTDASRSSRGRPGT